MPTNRSVPVSTVLPHLFYRSVAEAAAWLGETFGFVEHFRYGDPTDPEGVQMYLGDAVIMLARVRADGRASPAQVGHRTQMLTVFVEDVDAHFRRTKAAGARIVEELNETPYGERQYGAADLDGHRWLFASHARDVSPDAWGARVASPFPGSARGPT